MASLNKVELIGNLGADPEVRTVGNQAVANLRIATTDKFTTNNGETKEHTEWHRVEVWGKDAENCGKFLRKGSQVYVDGQIRTRDYEDKDGVARKAFEIKSRRVIFLGKAASDSDRAASSRPQQSVSPPSDGFSDQIPF